MSFLAVGSEFRCGYHLDTDVPAIQKFCCCRDIPTAIVPPLTHGDEPISSSHIRSAITCGELKAAAAMLGRPFTVDLAEASVVSADGISYDIAGQGCLLPPPGRYPVTLFDKNFDRGSARQTDIRIENGSIIISGHLSDTRWEYVEF
jgi:riboflavin kinase/FMN adenylyltransferase